MSLNETPSGERVHIAFFGKRNAGKSSLINAIAGQSLSIVSPVKGTTTDPVYKAMELLPAGPVMLVDTPGLDDEGELGMARVAKARQILQKTDLAILVIDAAIGKSAEDEALLDDIRSRGLPWLTVYNKADLAPMTSLGENEIAVSAENGQNIPALKERIAQLASGEVSDKRLVADLVSPLDLVVLVVPIDAAAPKGRLILPQQQTIRDLLEAGAITTVVRDSELAKTLECLHGQVKLVITDSQAFRQVSSIVPDEVLLTSFSILFARYKGDLAGLVRGAKALDQLRQGDKVLISEGCTHHRQCGDIGTEKLPRWLRQHAGCEPQFVFSSGREFPDHLSDFKLIIHCGGCMLNEREMQRRLRQAAAAGVPMTNYGISIAYMQGILERSLRPFPALHNLLS